MHSNWRTTTLGEALPFSYGKNLPAKTRSHSGEFDVVTSAGVVDSHNEAYVHVPSIVIGRKGTIGSLTFCPNPVWPTDTTFFATETDACNLRFGYYLLHTLHLRELNNDSAVPGLNRSDAHALEIHLPPRSEQVGIATVLGALDDKIVANQTSISKVDEILRALWQKELSLGNIDVPLSSLASFINGKAFTKGASGTGRVVVRIAEMNSGIGGKTVFSDFDADPDNEVNPGDLLFSWSGTLMTKRWPYDQAIVNQHIFKVVPNGQLDLWALRQAIDTQLEYFQMIAAGKATTMGHIKRGDLDQEVEVPVQMSEETNQLGNSLWGLATSLEIQNLQLARTRDELLPLLMSGRITVGEAEDAADEAASES
ncbi:restriction endonuclease subunit S [Corynebacterium marquesiae]|uniref:restriction endonuclease subunit S n=1 Tax=Corynebacterium marquesiae TaxID=2913503 RepID=UPI0022BA6D1D|nr:restriction endonuclease subunit S [Corynebacterium marquesiae]MCZ9301316.1 restriction endonuclease subunit S [Corynebacterium marquesiae]